MTNMTTNTIRANPVGLAVVGGIALLIVLYLFGIPGMGHRVDMKDLLSASIHVARLGGSRVKLIREEAKLNEQVKGKTKEGANELKTDGDMASHKIMYYGLKEAFPHIKVVSEEHDAKKVDLADLPPISLKLPEVKYATGAQVSASDITVWIDPLDATQEYTEDLTQYVTTMVCVAIRGKPVIGVIHKPFEDKTVWAYVGDSMSENLHLVKDVKHESGQDYKIIVSRSHSGNVKDVAEESFGKNIEVIPAGGAGYKTLEVIEGRADAYVHVTAIKKWDICAGDAILRAVNGQLTTIENDEIDYSEKGSPVNSNGLLATTKNHDKYLSGLKPAFDKMKEDGRKKRSIDEEEDKQNYRVAERESNS